MSELNYNYNLTTMMSEFNYNYNLTTVMSEFNYNYNLTTVMSEFNYNYNLTTKLKLGPEYIIETDGIYMCVSTQIFKVLNDDFLMPSTTYYTYLLKFLASSLYSFSAIYNSY